MITSAMPFCLIVANPGKYFFHLFTAQAFYALFAQHPLERINNIAFAASVRPYNTGNASWSLSTVLSKKI